MLKSMTGYGRAQQTIGTRNITIEIKSVNHRYFEFSSRVPRAYGYLEEKLKKFMQENISRGKVEIALTVINTENAPEEIIINKNIVEEYVNALRSLPKELDLSDDLSYSVVARLPDVFTIIKKDENEDEMWESILPILNEALKTFISMRVLEGEQTKQDLLARVDFIEKAVCRIEEQSPKTVDAYKERLEAKIRETLENYDIDNQRILTEVAVFADKVAVAEETTRLKSHIGQFRKLVESNEPVGRKLDFLIQEFNREANTIGSKCQDLAVTNIVVDIKAEIEKIREQIQNIE